MRAIAASALLFACIATGISGCEMDFPPGRLERTASFPVQCMADLEAAAGLACSFTHAATQPGDGLIDGLVEMLVTGGEFTPRMFSVDKASFDIRFVFDEGGAKIVGNAGVEPVAVIRAGSLVSTADAYQFVERTGTGVLQITAIDAGLNAVHSRHSVIGGELAPSQYYGRCRCLY